MEPDISDALSRLAKGNGILFARDSPCLAGVRSSLEASDRRSVVLWGLRNAERIASIVGGRHPLDPRPREAVRLCTMWSMGDVKMPEAKRAILGVHAMAREVGSPEDSALCHAVGQGCSVVHTPGHALGLPIYELTAAVLEGGDVYGRVSDLIAIYEATLDESSLHPEGRRWARFLRLRGRFIRL